MYIAYCNVYPGVAKPVVVNCRVYYVCGNALSIRASVDALCRDGTSETHVFRAQNASKLGEKA